MKILYVITKSNWGGAQRHVYDLASAMKDSGHTVIVALGGNGILRTKLEDIGIKTYAISELGRDVSIKKDAKSFSRIFSTIKRERPDIVHLHSPKAAGLGSIASRILRVKKIIYTVHGWAFNEERPWYQKIFIIKMSWLTMLCVHKIILLSGREYRQAEKFPITRHKLEYIPIGMKTPIFMSIDGAKQILARHIGIEITEFKKKYVIGTIAELHKNKGVEYLIDSLRPILSAKTDIISIIIGDGELMPDLHMQIRKAGLEDKIFLAGYMENASEYLKAFSLFTLSSIKEGLPYVILEAGSASLPVVATSVGGIPEIIEDMKSGVLVQSKNPEELGHAILYMIEHQHRAKQYGLALRETIINKFGFEKMIESLERVYKN